MPRYVVDALGRDDSIGTLSTTAVFTCQLHVHVGISVQVEQKADYARVASIYGSHEGCVSILARQADVGVRIDQKPRARHVPTIA